MKIDDNVASIIEMVKSGKFNELLAKLEGGDLGIFFPAYLDGDEVKPLPPGYMRSETNLKVEVRPIGPIDPKAKTIAWMGKGENAWSSCNHPGSGPYKCSHHDGRDENCIHCSGHDNPHSLGTPEGLDYHKAISQLNDKGGILDALAPSGLGLTLLHAHNDQDEFTKLPDNMVSVISDGFTSFRNIDDVLTDPTFVPNAWRVANGKLQVAGGFSLQRGS